MNKDLQRAIKEVLKVKVDRENYGMMSSKKANIKDLRLLDENNIDIYFGYHSKGFDGKNNVVVQNNKVIAVIKPRHATKKTNGMYKALIPTIEWL